MTIVKVEKQRSYKLVIFSFFLLNLLNWVIFAETSYGIPIIIKYVLSVFVLGTIVYYRLINPLKPSPGKAFYPVILIYLLWSLMLLISAILKFDNIFYLQRILAQPFFFIPYCLPLFILYSEFNLEFIRYFFKFSLMLIFPAILIQLYIILTGISTDNWFEQTNRIMIFDLGSSFLLLTAQFSKKKYLFNIVLIYTLLMIYLFAHYGRRGVLIEYMILLTIMSIIRIKSSLLNFNDRLKIYFAALILIIMVLSFGYLARSSYAFQRGFTKGAFEESRGVAFESFLYDFNSASDWTFGRGLDGKVLQSSFQDQVFSDYIENGFLQVVLKGGLIYLLLFISILLRACYLGFYKSNNDLVKAMASLILMYVIIMSYFNVPAFTTKYIFIWISVVVCFTPSIRNFNNEEIYQAINF